MSGGRPDATAREWLWVLAIVLVLGAVLAATQPFVKSEKAHDGNFYLRMTTDILRGAPPQMFNPFVLRVGTPWLAATLIGATGLSLMDAFFVINLIAGVATVLLFGVWLRAHVADAATRVWLVLFFAIAPHSPFRFTFYYPTLTDPLAMLCVMLGLITLDRLSQRVDAAGIAAMTAIVAVGCVFRELVLVLAIAALFVRPWSIGPRQWLARAVPLTGMLTMSAVRAWVIVTPSGYTIVQTILRWIAWKTPLMMAVASMFTFGPALVLPAWRWRDTWRLAQERPDLAVFCAVFFSAAWLGASDSERILEYMTPVVLMLIGRTLAGLRLAGAAGAFGATVVIQLLGYRPMLTIDGPYLPILTEHFSFYSTWVDVGMSLLFLTFYLIGSALIFAISRSAPFVDPLPAASRRAYV